MTAPFDRRKALSVAVLCSVWIASAIYVWGFVFRGWIPHDEGATALAAERVLHGELVHRDFEGAYTGGLAHVHALAFELLGTRLGSLRVVLFVSFLAFVPAVFAVARRFWSPLWAGALTLLCVVWSVPNYFASMPSWYNLFFAIFGTLAALRYVDTGRKVWLFGAGVCVGLSVLAKIVGLYFLAALLLFLAHAVQVLPGPEPSPGERRPRAFGVFLASCGVVLVALLVLLIRHRLTPSEMLHFVVPAGALAGYLVWYERTAARGSSGPRFRALFSLLAPLAAGVLVPVVLFLVPYVVSGSLGSIGRGLVENSRRQLANSKAMMYLPPLATFWAAMPYFALLAVPEIWPRRKRMLWAAGVAVVLAVLLALTDRTGIYRSVWLSARSLAVLAALAGCRFLFDADDAQLPRRRRLELFLLLSVAALVSLVQFPFALPAYFFYAAPAAILAVAALVASQAAAPRLVHAVVLAFYVGFAVWRLNPGYVFSIGDHPGAYRPTHRLALDRGGLIVPEEDGRVYEELVEAIRSVDPGPTLYATPDCPEVHFLAARRTPLSVFMDFQGPLYERHDAVLRLLERERIRAVVINRAPGFSRRLQPEMLAELERRFPRSRLIGRFELRWKEQAAPPPL